MRYNWPSLLAAENQAQQQRKIQHKQIIADLEQGAGTVIHIEIAPVLTDESRRFYFDPRGIMNVGEGRAIYPNFAELKAEPDYDTKVNQKVLVNKKHWALVSRLPPATYLSVTVSGVPVTLTDTAKSAETCTLRRIRSTQNSLRNLRRMTFRRATADRLPLSWQEKQSWT